MSALPAILPCPFCGSAAVIEEVGGEASGYTRFTVGCSEESDKTDICMGYQSLTTFNTRREAILAWNKRAPSHGDDRVPAGASAEVA